VTTIANREPSRPLLRPPDPLVIVAATITIDSDHRHNDHE
jgi:hypothetical protein